MLEADGPKGAFMRNYELMVVVDSSPDGEKIDQTVSKIQEMITAKGGKIVSVDNWGRRRLAYEIQRRQYGYYTLFVFELDPKEIRDLNRLLRLNPMVLRHLVILLDPKVMAKMALRPRGAVDDEILEDISEEIPDKILDKTSEEILEDTHEDVYEDIATGYDAAAMEDVDKKVREEPVTEESGGFDAGEVIEGTPDSASDDEESEPEKTVE
jgi:small subunit ribosomal protein S6